MRLSPASKKRQTCVGSCEQKSRCDAIISKGLGTNERDAKTRMRAQLRHMWHQTMANCECERVTVVLHDGCHHVHPQLRAQCLGWSFFGAASAAKCQQRKMERPSDARYVNNYIQ